MLNSHHEMHSGELLRTPRSGRKLTVLGVRVLPGNVSTVKVKPVCVCMVPQPPASHRSRCHDNSPLMTRFIHSLQYTGKTHAVISLGWPSSRCKWLRFAIRLKMMMCFSESGSLEPVSRIQGFENNIDQ